MDLDIRHFPENKRFETTVDGFTAFVTYRLENNSLDIVHTIVPRPIEGRGIAGELVRAAYDFAIENGMHCRATCPYAVVWLQRHPTYEEA